MLSCIIMSGLPAHLVKELNAGTVQIYTLGAVDFNCSFSFQKGIVIHELAHAQGILHEQSRPDRDNYVTINTANIISRYLGNFRKHSTGTVSGTRYDFGSVMHYGDKVRHIRR